MILNKIFEKKYKLYTYTQIKKIILEVFITFGRLYVCI